MINIFLHLVAAQGQQLRAGDDALVEGTQRRLLESRPQDRMSHENQLDRPRRLERVVGQQAELFKRRVIETLRLVENQHHPGLQRCRLALDEAGETVEACAGGANLQFVGDRLEQVGKNQRLPAADNADAVALGLQQRGNQRALARARLDGPEPISDVQFVNNTVVDVTQEAVILKRTRRVAVSNNIFYDVGHGADNYLAADPSSSDFVALANDMYMSDGSRPGSYGSAAPRVVIDPAFVDPAGLDFHLRPASRLIGTAAPSSPGVIDGHTAAPHRLLDPGAYQSR
jgi:hypothetical protein